MAKIIRDPIHNIIEVDEIALKLIDTYPFQRLRRIRQLGLGWLVYPAAEHSRLTHSIGVYGISKRIIKNLRQNSEKFKLTNEEERLIALAGLLHDIGHGPFSHALENAIKSLGGHFKHEEMSTKIIMDSDEITGKLTKGFGLNASGRICQIINKKYADPYVGSIISSQFDADRIDYLLRDSYMTGANYGKFDVDWLLKTISIKTATFPPVEGETVVCVDYKKGRNIVEQYLLGRHYMYSHVYYHKVIRGFEIVVTNIIRRVITQEHKNLVGYRPITSLYNNTLSLGEYLKLDDFKVIGWFNEWYNDTKDPILKDLLFHFFCRKPYYKAIYPPDDRVQYSSKKDEILNRFQNPEEQDYFFHEDSPKNVTYKSLYMGDVLDEIYIAKNQEVIPLSALNDSIINEGQAILNKDEVRWYIKREGGNGDDGIK